MALLQRIRLEEHGNSDDGTWVPQSTSGITFDPNYGARCTLDAHLFYGTKNVGFSPTAPFSQSINYMPPLGQSDFSSRYNGVVHAGEGNLLGYYTYSAGHLGFNVYLEGEIFKLHALHNHTYAVAIDNVEFKSRFSPTKHVLITYTFDGSSIRLYVDTVLVATTSKSGTFYNGSAFCIGGYHDTNISYTEGFYRDYRIYTHALSQAEINTLPLDYTYPTVVKKSNLFNAPDVFTTPKQTEKAFLTK